MRYYFHVSNRDRTILDSQGIELADDEADHIGSIIEEMRMKEPELFDLTGVWVIEIVNEKGYRIARFPFATAVSDRSVRDAGTSLDASVYHRRIARRRGA